MFGQYFGNGFYGDGYFGPAPAGGAVAVTPTPQRRGAMYPGGWVPDRLYVPPRKKIKKKALAELKELYEEAREVIPEPLQHSLIPSELIRGRASSVALPPPAEINFEGLARSLDTIRVLIAAIEAAEKARIRRRKEDDMIIQFLMQLED